MSWTNSEGETIPGSTDGDDIFTGDGTANVEDAQGGGDAMFGAGGNDSLVGGAGDDAVRGDAGNDTLVGGDGHDWLIGGANDDSLSDSGGGEVILQGDAGNDTLVATIDGAYGGPLGGVQLSGGEGNDSIVASGPGLDDGGVGFIAPTIYGDGGNDTIIGTDIDDLNYGGDQIFGGTGDDSILAGAGNDVVDLSTGNDTARAGDGDDDIRTSGVASVDGGSGSDSLNISLTSAVTALGFTVDGAGVMTGSNGSRAESVEHFTIRTGTGNDTIITGDGDDFIVAGAGTDLLQGGAGDDYLQGDAGNDTLIGGAGYDSLVGGADEDSINDSGGDGVYVDGGSGNDTITVTVDGADVGFGTNINGGGGDDSIIVSGPGLEAGGFRYGVNIAGGTGNDTITGTDAVDPNGQGDFIFGDVGNDSIVGGMGNDYIDAGDGDDTVVWNIGDGDDIAVGGIGTDTLSLEGWTDSGANPWSVSIDGATTWYTHTPSGAVLETLGFENVVCFAQGTRILTPLGEVPVESLRAGDRVIVVSGSRRSQALRWVGRMEIDIARARDRVAVAPVLIRAGALGAGVPFRDMRVSPEHGMLLDGRLVPARLLVDGAGIIQELWRRAVTYWHLELDAHGVLVADGALSESYFDDGNRHLFDNAGVVAMRPGFDRAPGSPYAEAACMPPILDAADPALGLIRARFPVLRRTA